MSKENMNHIYGGIADRRGKQSEYRVADAIRRRADTITVIEPPKWGPDDMAGIDIRARFAKHDEKSNTVIEEEVLFQVKSSWHAEDKFKRKKQKQWGLATTKQVEEEIVIVNGQLPHGAIDASINSQLENRGIGEASSEAEPKFEDIKEGKVVQLFPPPQQMKRAA